MTPAQREALAIAHRNEERRLFGVSYAMDGIDPSTLRSLEAKGYLYRSRPSWWRITDAGRRARLEIMPRKAKATRLGPIRGEW